MYQLSEESVRQWLGQGANVTPRSFALTCPHYSDLVTFTTTDPQKHPQAQTTVSIAKCPACTGVIKTFTVHGNPSDGCKTNGIFVFPTPVTRQPLANGEITKTPAVDRAYRAAVHAFNVGLWDACATSCRKTLEGIVKTQGSSGSTLFQQLKDFFETQDLSQPLIHLADTVRTGGNLGAHFDLDKETDQHIAKMMLDLIEYFLEFIYLLPDQSQALEARLKSLNAGSANTLPSTSQLS